MDIAFIDELAKKHNGLQVLQVRQHSFNSTMDAKGKKTKESTETQWTFSTMITKKDRPSKISVDKWTEFAGEFNKLCNAQGTQISSKLSETKAAFA